MRRILIAIFLALGLVSAAVPAAWALDPDTLRQDLIAEISQPTLDEARVNELLRERSKLFVTYLGGVMSETHAFLDGLEPEKKQEFLAMMGQEHRFLWRLLGDRGRDGKKSQP